MSDDREESLLHRIVNDNIINEPIIDEIFVPLTPNVTGYANEPLVILEEACEPLQSLVNNLFHYVAIAKNKSQSPANGLTQDESAAIYLYTLEWKSSDSVSFYVVLNQMLRAPERSEATMKPWYKYLKLVLTALAKLPTLPNGQHIVYRGVTGKVDDKVYKPGSIVIWWAFSTCTNSLSLLQSPKFLGTTGERTIFNIETSTGKNISLHSRYSREDEVLLMPATYMEVISRVNPAPQLNIIHLRERKSSKPLLELPFEGAFDVREDTAKWFKTKRFILAACFATLLSLLAIILGSILGTQLKKDTVTSSIYFSECELLCTLTNQQLNCNSSNIIVSILNNGTWIDTIYANRSMRIQLRQHPLNFYFDVSIYLSFNLIYTSQGLCHASSDYCQAESIGTSSRSIPILKAVQTNITSSAVQVCNSYLYSAINLMGLLNMTYQSGIVSNLNISCLHDVLMTNDLTIGLSSISVLLAEGINSLNLNDQEYLAIVNRSVSLVNQIWQNLQNITTITTTTTTTRILPNISANAVWTNISVIVAGGNSFGNATNQLYYPCGLSMDNNQTIYIADRINKRIMAWKSGATSGQIIVGNNIQSNQTIQFGELTDVYFDIITNSLLICDWSNRRIVQWSLQNSTTNGKILLNISCYGVTMDDQRYIYGSDIVNNEVRHFQIGDTIATLINSNIPLNYSSIIFIDRNYSIYTADTFNNRVIKWDANSTSGIVVAGGQGLGKNLSQLNLPFGVYVDQLGTVYVSDSNNQRIVRWVKNATQGTIIIDGSTNATVNGQWKYPRSITVDQYGNFYVVDWGNHRVLRYDILTK